MTVAIDERVVPYGSSWDHLADELARLELIVRANLLLAGVGVAADGPDALRGLYLSAQDLARLLTPSIEGDQPDVVALRAQSEALAAKLAARRAASLAENVQLRLPLLAQLIGLTALEEQVLVACLAPEIDARYERFFAYLNDDLTRKGPTPQLAVSLLVHDLDARVQARSLLSAGSRLFRAGLLHLSHDGPPGRSNRVMTIDERIADFLLGLDDLPASIEPFTSFSAPERPRNVEQAEPVAAGISHHLNAPSDRGRLFVYLEGPPGSGRRRLARAVCGLLSMPLLEVDLEALSSQPEPVEPSLRIAVRETLLRPAALFLSGLDRAFQPQMGDQPDLRAPRAEPSWRNPLLRAIEDFAWLTFVSGERPFLPPSRWNDHTWLHVRVARADEGAHGDVWTAALAEAEIALPVAEVTSLAGRFRFTPGQVRHALRAARSAVALTADPSRTPDAGDVARASRRQAGLLFEGLADRIEPRYTWDDIALPSAPLLQLREMTAEVRHRQLVYADWGFGDKHSRGRGLAALFSGASGTGKTMAAEIVAGDLELDLYRIDLSSVVSKYIGETEKNLARIFASAERGSAVLFFDEADALFGKRSDVKDAHDRYANVEISYLLQRIEAYDGIVILATNLKGNMDEAFTRRLRFLIEFPFPDAKQRRAIWQGLFPPRAPRNPDIDFDFLADRLAVPGGSIRNIVVHAAFLAAADDESIGMVHVMRAAKREYDKIGHLGSEAEFGRYWPLVRTGAR